MGMWPYGNVGSGAKKSKVFSMLFITLMCISYNSNNTPVET